MPVNRVLNYARHQSSGWCSIFGWGVAWRNLHVSPMYFSERNGFAMLIAIRGWMVKLIRPGQVNYP